MLRDPMPRISTNISVLWSGAGDLFELVDGYLAGLRSAREVTVDEERAIKRAISRLHSLTSFPFTALELSASINEEQVAEVLVRVNRKGTPLNQADFILTLMSVFWDEGRSELERFCRESRTPSTGRPSPFNHFMRPGPDQLLGCPGLLIRRRKWGSHLEPRKFATWATSCGSCAWWEDLSIGCPTSPPRAATRIGARVHEEDTPDRSNGDRDRPEGA